MDEGAWWEVHGVAKSWAQLSNSNYNLPEFLLKPKILKADRDKALQIKKKKKG